MKTFTADEIAMAIDTIGNTVYRDTVANSDRNCLLDIIAQLQAENAGLREACEGLVNAKALAGVRELVAGWNGENRPKPYTQRHPDRLGATLPKTNCGAVYALDEAMQAARAALEDKE